MKKPRPATLEATCLRCRPNNRPRHALPVAVACALIAAVTAAAAPLLPAWAPESAFPAVPTAPSGPGIAAPAVPVRLDAAPLSPAAESLAGAVARRYRIAGESAREVVGAAFHEGRRHGLDPVLILAVIAVESRFNPIAQSEQGAVGLMQVVPRFHADKLAEAGARSALAPHANIAIGTRILKESIRRGGGEAAGLQLYNGAVNDETNAYANRVQAERRRLEEALPRTRDRA